jgi:hypothetical protein
VIPLLVGCASPRFSATIEQPGPGVGGVVWLDVVLDEPADVEVSIGRRTAVFPSSGRSVSVPILGFPPGERVALVVGALGEERDLAFVSPAQPPGLPVVDVLISEPERAEPGWTLVEAILAGEPTGWLLLLDDTGSVIWWWDTATAPADARLDSVGTLWFLAEGGAQHSDWFGHPLAAVPPADLNHELQPIPGGFLTLSHQSVAVPAYPLSEEDPAALAPATIDGGAILDIDTRGEVRRRWLLSDVLDPTRIGYDSLSTIASGYDWAHPNGVVPDADGLIVSARHQDAVIRLDGAGALDWILGTPAGWTAPWTDHLLAPVGAIVWPYHAHAPEVAPDGTILLFDNHDRGYDPYEDEVAPLRSGVAGFRVEDRSVQMAFRFDATATGPLYSWAGGDCDVQPTTGNVLVNYGLLDAEGTVPNVDLGWGAGTARIVEYTPAGEIVGDFRLRSDRATEPTGWHVYRVERIADPWGDGGAWRDR